MTDSYKLKLTSKNFIFLLIATMQEVTFLQLARRSAEYAGHDAWISILLASTLALASLYIINKLCKRLPSLTLAEMTDKICGVVLGKIISLLYILYFIVYSAMVVRIFVEVLNSYLFIRTPGLVLSLIMVLTITYISSQDIRTIAWMNELTQYVVQLLWVAVIFGLVRANFNNLLPIGDAGIKNIILGSQGAFFAYLGPEILLVIYPFIQNKKEVFKAGVIAVGFSAFVYTSMALVVILAFGETVLNLIVWDFLALIKTYRLPLLERAEFFVVVFWSWLAIRSSANHLYMAKHTFAKAAGLKEKYHLYVYLALAAAVLSLSRLPENTAQVLIYTKPLGIIGIFIMMLGLPAILLTISVIRGIREK